jgi:Tol biopolymer transport system component
VLLADVSVNTPRWSPDGKSIAVAVFQAPEATGALAGGVYLIPADGGKPELLQANDKVADPANPSPEARGFAPKAWSPDGRQLLLGTFSMAVEICGTAVKDLASGTLVDVIAPEGLAACEGGAWSPDGTTIYIGMHRPGYLAPVPGLWRADARTGEAQPYIVGEPEQGTFTLVRGVHPLKDGSVYAFLGTTDKLPDPGVDDVAWPQFTLSRVSADGAQVEKLNDATYENPGDNVRWAADGSGAVIEQYNPQGATLLWLPADGAEPVTISEGLGAGDVRWGAVE